MRKGRFFAALLLVVFFAQGCETRSISNSGYPRDYRSRNPYYAGELSELDVLGVADARVVTDADIKKTYEGRRDVKIPKGSSIIVIQSGALSPDEPMMEALTRHFKVVPFSGVPTRGEEAYSKKLRLTASAGGFSHVLCYWGTLETAVEDKETKVVSWIPIAGGFIPDESQRMRIRLRAALIDVPSGAWTMITPEPIDDSSLSSAVTRVRADKKQVQVLKEKGYGVLVSELSRYFSS